MCFNLQNLEKISNRIQWSQSIFTKLPHVKAAYSNGNTFYLLVVKLVLREMNSNINEVIRAVLNFLFFLQKDFAHRKSTKRTKGTKRTKSTKGTKKTSTKRHNDTQAKAQKCK